MANALKNLWGFWKTDKVSTEQLLKALRDNPALDTILLDLEELRRNKQNSTESPDFIIRVCESIVAKAAGYEHRTDWQYLQTTN